MRTYAVRGTARKTTGHYRRPGTQDLYCGRPAGTPNDREVHGFRLCTRCVKAEATDRAAAEKTAAAWLDQAPAAVRQAVTEAAKERTARTAARDLLARQTADDEARYAVALVTEAEATDGTWRGVWIGENTTATAPALFDLPTEQGALFA